MRISCVRNAALPLVVILLVSTISRASRAAEDGFAALIERRVIAWQPTRDERLLDQVGWASDLVEAKRLAKEHGRPLFVFTYNGSTVRSNAIALQRC